MYKKFTLGIIFVFLMIITAVLYIDYRVDAIGIWGAPLIRGFNHYKTKQENFHDVFKPYEYKRMQPSVLYLGGSQTARGFIPNIKMEEYNMGINSTNLWDLKEYLQFIYKVHKPKVIYLGIMADMFRPQSYYTKKPTFSKTRLENLSDGSFSFCAQIVEDSWNIHEYDILTIKESWKHRKEEEPYRLGWNMLSGKGKTVNSGTYYNYIYSFTSSYKAFEECSPEAMDCFKEIVREAEERDCRLIVAIMPFSIDLYAILELRGMNPVYKSIKREMAAVTPVYDFQTVNELTTNRDLFEDLGHFRASLGEKLKPILEGKAHPEPYGYLLTPETVDTAFAVEDAAWEKWRAENAEYVQALTECIESGRKPQVGDFAKYIGF